MPYWINFLPSSKDRQAGIYICIKKKMKQVNVIRISSWLNPSLLSPFSICIINEYKLHRSIPVSALMNCPLVGSCSVDSYLLTREALSTQRQQTM